MCREKIHLFEHWQFPEFPEPLQTVPSSKENNFLCEAGLLAAGTHPREAARPVFLSISGCCCGATPPGGLLRYAIELHQNSTGHTGPYHGGSAD
jgi:hypothetical protein